MVTETETLTLNDGTVLDNSNVYPDENSLYVYVENGFGLREVFELLIDEEKTQTIIRNTWGQITEFEGYTKLTAVRDEGKGLITAVLRKQ